MKIVVNEFISLDGVVQAPGGPDEDVDGGFRHGGWSHPFFDPEVMGAAVGEGMVNTDAYLYGRRTYKNMESAFGNGTGDPFGETLAAMPKYVASRTFRQQDVTWTNTTVLPADDALGAIRQLKDRPGRNLTVVGSANLATQLVEQDLIDEYVLMIEPIALGGGKRLFPFDGVARRLELTDTRVAGTGVIVATYRRSS